MGLAVIFPGQGIQNAGMGEPWRAHPAWSVVERAEDAWGRPLGPLLLDPGADLSRTREAQLAVLLASLLCWEAVRDRMEPPVAFAGHSLGQLTALVASGVLTLEDGVRLTAARAASSQRAADRRPGTMAALLGATVELAQDACAAAEGACWVANDNAPGQVVVGGTTAGVKAAGARALELGARRVLPLNVAGAFHTPLMSDARQALLPTLAEVPLAEPSAPVVSNADAVGYRDAEGWRTRLADHLVSPVRWRSSVETLSGLGADDFVEVGPGGVLAGLVRRTLPGARARSVAVPTDVDERRQVAEMQMRENLRVEVRSAG